MVKLTVNGGHEPETKVYHHYICWDCGVDTMIRVDDVIGKLEVHPRVEEFKEKKYQVKKDCSCGGLEYEKVVMKGRCSRCKEPGEEKIGKMTFCNECAPEVKGYVYE